MKLFAASLIAALSVFSSPVLAQSNPVVVELFTSQGCSSCPPADKLLHDLAKRDDVIALALHVDYWDYIGWKDEYADPAHTVRQKAYAQAGHRNMIYTPQMIINGQEDIVGARSMELADLIAAHRKAPVRVTVSATRDGGKLQILVAPAAAPVKGPLDVQIVRYTPHHETNITRGENAGRVLEYANVVDGWRLLGQWNGVASQEFDADLSGARPAVVLIQEPGPGAILAAARID